MKTGLRRLAKQVDSRFSKQRGGFLPAYRMNLGRAKFAGANRHSIEALFPAVEDARRYELPHLLHHQDATRQENDDSPVSEA